VQHKLVFEFGWRAYFRHVWSHLGDGILASRHEGPCPERSYAKALPDDIRRGCTGIPVIDQAVRTLYACGTLHNHARMWLASYVVHIRHVHWRTGADWMVAHLLDGDLVSNHLSWQWVAGTASHKPYLFTAENVTRFAPADWHSPGTVIDQPYEVLEQLARDPSSRAAPLGLGTPAEEPTLFSRPPDGLLPLSTLAHIQELVQGRSVWLVHPWALRAPPEDLPTRTLVIGVYPEDHHRQWPWPRQRWLWVDAAMSAITAQRCWVDAPGLRRALAGAAGVQTIRDPHLPRWLLDLAHPREPRTLFPTVPTRCDSFSRWWALTTRGLRNASDLLDAASH